MVGFINGIVADIFNNYIFSKTNQRPNVLFICVDDVNDTIGAFSGPTSTLNIDNLANDEISFINAHCPGVFSAPSCTAILTGQNATRTGFYKEAISFVARPDSISLPQVFRNTDYNVVGTGEIYRHMPGFLELEAFDEYYVHNEEAKEEGWRTFTYRHHSEPRPSDLHPMTKVLNKPLRVLYRVPNELEEQKGDIRNAS